MPDETHGHQHDHEPVHDQGQGHAGRGSGHAGSKADEEQGGGRRDHRASGSHTTNTDEATRDNIDSTSGNQGGSGNSK